MLHKHHIIPRHAGGTDDPSNLILLTIEEHAEAHRVLYEQYGRWQDKVAWKGLAAEIGQDDIIFQKNSLAHKGKKPRLGIKHTEETKRKISLKNKGSQPRLGAVLSEETKQKMRNSHLGKPSWTVGLSMPDETKRKLSLAKRGIPNPKLKKTYQITYPDGSLHIVIGLLDFAKLNNLNAGNLLSLSGSRGYKATRILQ